MKKGRARVLHIEIHVTPRYLRVKEDIWTDQTWVLQMQVRVFAVTFWTRNRTSQRIHCFEMICLKQLAERSKTGMKQGLSKTSLGLLPSAETLATYGANNLNHLIKGVDEGWIGNIPVEGPRPQQDYSVGFRRSAFTDEQLNKLDPLIGSVYENCFFEVKCGAAALDVADRQNAHSMTVAVRVRQLQ